MAAKTGAIVAQCPADRGRVLNLFDMIMKGDAAGALTELGA